MGYRGKRVLDLAVAIPALVLLSPVMLVVATLVLLKMGRPILYLQQRPGLHGRPFVIYKFRTMTDDRDEAGALLPNLQRLTPFGKRLRSTSLDELPELINVVRGEMSIVGPRPLLTEYLERYTPEQARRHHVKPGITGWAQVNGRNAISWNEKLAQDVWYVDHMSFWLDLIIVLKTIRFVVLREGITPSGAEHTPEFAGSVSRRGDDR
jgi:sugar transferase EpsL